MRSRRPFRQSSFAYPQGSTRLGRCRRSCLSTGVYHVNPSRLLSRSGEQLGVGSPSIGSDKAASGCPNRVAQADQPDCAASRDDVGRAGDRETREQKAARLSNQPATSRGLALHRGSGDHHIGPAVQSAVPVRAGTRVRGRSRRGAVWRRPASDGPSAPARLASAPRLNGRNRDARHAGSRSAASALA